MLTITKKLDISPRSVPHSTPQVINVSQYDSDFEIQFKLYASTGTFTIEEGTTAAIKGTKPSGTGYSADASIDIETKTVTVSGDVQMTAAAGRCIYEIALYKDNKEVNSANFILLVERAALDADTITDESVLRNLEAIVEGAETATQAADDAVDAKTAAEAAQAAAEAAAEQAEGAIEVDNTLSIEGRAADAKKTGDEITGLKEDFIDVEGAFEIEQIASINLLDASTVTHGKYCTNTGAIETNEVYWYTDFIPVTPGKTYTRQRGTQTVLTGREIAGTRWISCYDSDKNILADLGATNVSEFTVPEGVAFIRFSDSTYMNYNAHPAVVEGTTVLDYEEYFLPYRTFVLRPEATNDAHILDLIHEETESRHITNGMVYSFDVNSDNHELNDTNTLVEDMFGYSIQFDGRVTTFNGLTLGHGNGTMYGGYVKITPTHFEYYLGTESNPRLSEAHNLTIADYISVRIDAKPNIKADFTIYTNGGVYTKADQTWDVRAGRLFVNSNGINVLTGCTFAYMCRGWAEKVHLYGDSYFGVYTDKWTKYLTTNNWNKCNVNAYPGRASAEALRVAKNVLNHSNPEMIVWCMGMNDGDDGGSIDATWKACVDELMTICTSRKIELVLATIPNVPSVDNTAKNAYVKASGYRYIDFASAVGASSGATWFDGMLSSDNVHPGVQGAIALFNQAIADVPELMQ